LAYTLFNNKKSWPESNNDKTAAVGMVMAISNRPGFRLGNMQRRLIVAVGLCAVFLVVAANAARSNFLSSAMLDYEAAENSGQQIRIKRLKPADPESTEVMLAARGLHRSARAQGQGSA
jgi:hypothetical protein